MRLLLRRLRRARRLRLLLRFVRRRRLALPLLLQLHLLHLLAEHVDRRRRRRRHRRRRALRVGEHHRPADGGVRHHHPRRRRHAPPVLVLRARAREPLVVLPRLRHAVGAGHAAERLLGDAVAREHRHRHDDARALHVVRVVLAEVVGGREEHGGRCAIIWGRRGDEGRRSGAGRGGIAAERARAQFLCEVVVEASGAARRAEWMARAGASVAP